MTDAWGIDHGYHDWKGEWHDIPPETVAALRHAMGAPHEPPPDTTGAVRFVRAGDAAGSAPGWLALEDGTELEVRDHLPPDLPLGYHTFRPEAAPESTQRLIVAPGRCHLPDGFRAWCVSAQLYATRSHRSWGMGDLEDLGRLTAWARQRGAGALMVNPLHAVAPVVPQQASPYSPASRRFRNPLYIAVESVPGAGSVPEVEAAAAAGRALNQDRLVHRDRVLELKVRALEAVWRARPPGAELDEWVRATPAAAEWGAWCAIAERHGPDWRRWPAGLQDPRSGEVHRFASEHPERVRFHQWLQWLAERQLHDAARGVTVVQDLPIGVDPGGFDAWTWRDVLASEVTVGAPPDALGPLGQDWGLPPFVPHLLRAAGYEPFVQTLRATIAGAGGLRIDHVMGLFRLFWIPPGEQASAGAYVRYPAHDLLDIVCLESVRAGALVVGEDLGTVEAGVREAMAERAMLSYKLLWFEPEDPAHWPAMSFAAVTTHDLPTVAGLWTGSDLAEQHALGLDPDPGESAALRQRLAERAGLGEGAPVEEAVLGAHRALARAPSAVLCATLDDAIAEPVRPNFPGTVHERPNWSLALPVPLEELESHPLANEVARILDRAVHGPPA